MEIDRSLNRNPEFVGGVHNTLPHKVCGVPARKDIAEICTFSSAPSLERTGASGDDCVGC